MIELNQKQIEKIKLVTLESFPEEMCGVLTADDFIQIKNVHSKPLQSFTMDRVQYGQVVEYAVAIVHSHVKQAADHLNVDIRTPSIKDRRFQKLSGLPWLIVGTEGQTVTPAIQFPRTPTNDYVGRDFIWHINDCYSLVQDYYQFEMDIVLLDSAIDFDPINGDINDVFAGYIEDYGFKDIFSLDEIKNGDLVLLDAVGFKKNHLGIYHNEKVLHQMQKSRFDPIANYQGRINRILRYAG